MVAPASARANLLRVPDAVNTAAALEWLEEWLLRAGGSTRLMPALETALRCVSRCSSNMEPTCLD